MLIILMANSKPANLGTEILYCNTACAEKISAVPTVEITHAEAEAYR